MIHTNASSLPLPMVLARETALQSGPSAATRVYRLCWRIRESHPWRREAHTDRNQAYNRYFSLLDRGVEVRFEAFTRQA